MRQYWITVSAAMICAVIACSTAATATNPPPQIVDVFVGGQEGYNTFRIPSIVQIAQGRLLAFAEGRTSGDDNGANDLVMKMSDDLGNTWTALRVVDDQPGRSLNNPCVVEVRKGAHAGRIIVMYQSYPTGCGEGCVEVGYEGAKICRTFVKYSEDRGTTWSTAADVTTSVKRPTIATSVATGPGVGIQLRRGAHAGRLVMPFNQGPAGAWTCYGVYSDDGGDTWKCGDVAANSKDGVGNEVQIAERIDGTLVMNSRRFAKEPRRKIATSSDGGVTWTALTADDELPDPSCMAGFIVLTDPLDGFAKSRMIFTGPDSTTARENGCAWLSYDGGATWPVKQQIYAGAFAYSVPVTLDRNKFGVLFERDGYKRISLAIVDFAWFCGGKDEMLMMKNPN